MINRSNPSAKFILPILIVAFGMCASAAHAWWNDQWQYRRKISIDTTDAGANVQESLVNVPVLLRLHMGNFDFANARSNGDDIRFVADDDTTQLKYHIEKLDTLEETAIVWVNVPRVPANSKLAYVWMYYGNEDAIASQDTGGGVYDASQAAVFHFNETDGPPKDATANSNIIADFSVGQGFPSAIGNGVVFNGISDRLRIAASPSLHFAQGWTFSAWMKIANPQNMAHLFTTAEENPSIVIGINQESAYGRLLLADGSLVEVGNTEATRITPNIWHRLTLTAASDKHLIMYIDGSEVARSQITGELAAIDADLIVGSSGQDANYFAGEMDELQLSGIARTPGWIRATYSSQGPDAALLRVGVEVMSESGGLPVFYLATVLKNITLDGWVIICILIALMVTSWIIILSKSFFIWLIDRQNKKFAAAYNAQGNPTSFADDSEAYENASLYRIYRAGCRSIADWMGAEAEDKEKITLPKKALDSFKAALDRSYIEESKRINAWLVVLTFAITGGPFLGLLGTVWGVMNTFAAMAEAGEANIMAIAPGVASALSTTVFGLIVAIPALFGYNFITSRIKNITADMNIFIDSFTLKVDQAHGEDA